MEDASDGYELVLIRRVADGDMEAFGLLFERYHSRLRRYLRRRLYGETGRIDDVHQKIWIEVRRSASSFKGRGAVKNWIYGFARNLTNTEIESAEFRHARDQVPLPEQPDSDAAHGAFSVPSPEDVTVRWLDVSAALAKLPRKHRIPIMLAAHGLSKEELAVVLDIAPNAVKGRLFAAREALREITKLRILVQAPFPER